MSLENTTLFQMLGTKMDWLSQRQSVLAANIANANTPGYQARDLKPVDFRDALRGEGKTLHMARTNPAHVDIAPGEGGYSKTTSHASYETTLDGNGVVLEEQMMKLNKTSADYKLATELFRKYMGMYKAAISGGK